MTGEIPGRRISWLAASSLVLALIWYAGWAVWLTFALISGGPSKGQN
jgi:hypothetical protein